MGRKKKTFYEVVEGAKGYEIVLNTSVADAIAEEEDAGERRPQRGDHRESMRDMKLLCNRMAKLPRFARRALPLAPEILDQLDAVADAGVSNERRRLLMRLKLLMRDVDLDAIDAALDGDTPAASRSRELERWRTKILAGGDDELQAFVTLYPGGDMQRMRLAAREARGTGPAAARALKRLFVLLKECATPKATVDETVEPPAE